MKARPTPYQYRSGLPACEIFRQPGDWMSISSTLSPPSLTSAPKPLRLFPLPGIISAVVTPPAQARLLLLLSGTHDSSARMPGFVR